MSSVWLSGCVCYVVCVFGLNVMLVYDMCVGGGGVFSGLIWIVLVNYLLGFLIEGCEFVCFSFMMLFFVEKGVVWIVLVVSYFILMICDLCD